MTDLSRFYQEMAAQDAIRETSRMISEKLAAEGIKKVPWGPDSQIAPIFPRDELPVHLL